MRVFQQHVLLCLCALVGTTFARALAPTSFPLSTSQKEKTPSQDKSVNSDGLITSSLASTQFSTASPAEPKSSSSIASRISLAVKTSEETPKQPVAHENLSTAQAIKKVSPSKPIPIARPPPLSFKSARQASVDFEFEALYGENLNVSNYIQAREYIAKMMISEDCAINVIMKRLKAIKAEDMRPSKEISPVIVVLRVFTKEHLEMATFQRDFPSLPEIVRKEYLRVLLNAREADFKQVSEKGFGVMAKGKPETGDIYTNSTGVPVSRSERNPPTLVSITTGERILGGSYSTTQTTTTTSVTTSHTKSLASVYNSQVKSLTSAYSSQPTTPRSVYSSQPITPKSAISTPSNSQPITPKSAISNPSSSQASSPSRAFSTPSSSQASSPKSVHSTPSSSLSSSPKSAPTRSRGSSAGQSGILYTKSFDIISPDWSSSPIESGTLPTDGLITLLPSGSSPTIRPIEEEKARTSCSSSLSSSTTKSDSFSDLLIFTEDDCSDEID